MNVPYPLPGINEFSPRRYNRDAMPESFEGLPAVGRMLLALGAVLLLLGAVFIVAGKLPLAGRLPGDIVYRRGSFTFYFPLVTCLVVSALVSLVLWLIRK